jgi:hypothetical protein
MSFPQNRKNKEKLDDVLPLIFSFLEMMEVIAHAGKKSAVTNDH